MKKVLFLALFAFLFSSCWIVRDFTAKNIEKTEVFSDYSYLYVTYLYAEDIEMTRNFRTAFLAYPYQKVGHATHTSTTSGANSFSGFKFYDTGDTGHLIFQCQTNTEIRLEKFIYENNEKVFGARQFNPIILDLEPGNVYYLGIYIYNDPESIMSYELYHESLLNQAFSASKYAEGQNINVTWYNNLEYDMYWFDSAYPELADFNKINLTELLPSPSPSHFGNDPMGILVGELFNSSDDEATTPETNQTQN